MPKLLVTDAIQLGDATFDDVEVVNRAGIAREDLLEVIQDYDALVTRSRTQVDAALLDAAPRLKVVGRGGVGVDNIDLDAASRRGVVVLNAPEANNVSAAELAVALLLAAARGVGRSDRAIRAGTWDRAFLGREIKGARLGIVGLGRIGSLVATRAAALGMEVAAYDPYIAPQRAERLGVELIEALPDLLARSDALSVHTPLTDETDGMIGPDELATLPSGSIVVNAARGGIVQEAALADALEAGHLFAAGLDVFRSEPPPADHPLVQRDDVVHTAHLGANTREAQARIGAEIVERTVQALRGEFGRGVVNAPALASDVLQELGPYLELGEVLGATVGQLLAGRVHELTIELAGEFPRDPAPIGTAVTKGFLEPFLSDPPNYVNAGAIARDRDVRVATTIATGANGYTRLVTVGARGPEGEASVAGTVLGGVPRITRVDDFAIEIKPAPAMLICTNVDRPGAVGRVGTLLGDAGVNIVGMQLSRVGEDGLAMFALTLDDAPEAPTLDALRAQTDVIRSLRLVRL